MMAYALGTLLLLGIAVGIAFCRGRRRRAREMEALRAVMAQVMDGDPEAPRDEI